jgi:putative membrane protein
MLIESLLAYAHLIAVLTLVVFFASETALCRPEWINAAVVERLVRVDRICAAAAIAVLATGLARVFWGAKGAGWYWDQPLLYLKIGLFIVIAALSFRPTRSFAHWRRRLHADGSTLPSSDEVRAVRRIIFMQAHLLVLPPLLAVWLARGVFTR